MSPRVGTRDCDCRLFCLINGECAPHVDEVLPPTRATQWTATTQGHDSSSQGATTKARRVAFQAFLLLLLQLQLLVVSLSVSVHSRCSAVVGSPHLSTLHLPPAPHTTMAPDPTPTTQQHHQQTSTGANPSNGNGSGAPTSAPHSAVATAAGSRHSSQPASRRASQIYPMSPPPLPLASPGGSIPTHSHSHSAFPPLSPGPPGLGLGYESSGVPTPMRHPKPLTPAELHLELEKEQEAVVCEHSLPFLYNNCASWKSTKYKLHRLYIHTYKVPKKLHLASPHPTPLHYSVTYIFQKLTRQRRSTV
jgi:hypothetical protein